MTPEELATVFWDSLERQRVELSKVVPAVGSAEMIAFTSVHPTTRTMWVQAATDVLKGLTGPATPSELSGSEFCVQAVMAYDPRPMKDAVFVEAVYTATDEDHAIALVKKHYSAVYPELNSANCKFHVQKYT
jgi:hypothetical protein